MKLAHFFSNAIGDLVHLLFPELCCACGCQLYAGETSLCTACLYDLPYTDHHLYADNKAARKLWGRIPFHAIMAFLHFRKAGPVQELIHQLKYRNRQDLGQKLGRMLGEKLREAPLYKGIDCILPVPLHQKKEKLRGYNQSRCIAEGIAEVLGVPVLDQCLIRSVATSSQTRKSRYKRYENMKDVFEVRQAGQLSGRHVLLIDDVITTGATLEACALVLQQAGIGSLSIAVLAFAD